MPDPLRLDPEAFLKDKPRVSQLSVAECFLDGFSFELCCLGEGLRYGCWDAQFTPERCCGPDGGQQARAWDEFARDMTDFDFGRCADFVRQFDWSASLAAPEQQSTHRGTRKYAACLQLHRHNHGSKRPAALAGVMHPTLIAPINEMRYAVLPAWDLVDADAMRKVGTADVEELLVYRTLAPAGSVFVDAGAHLGAFTVPMAEHLGSRGAVVAWEPFRLIYQLLVANVAVNGVTNVFARHAALSSKPGRVRVRSPAMKEPMHLGRVRVFDQESPDVAYRNYLSYDGEETIPVETIDGFDWSEVSGPSTPVLVKVDTEGHNAPLMAGAIEMLRKRRPTLVVEEADDGWLEQVASLGYDCRFLLPRTRMFLCLPESHLWVSVAATLSTALRCSTRRASMPANSQDLVPCRILARAAAEVTTQLLPEHKVQAPPPPALPHPPPVPPAPNEEELLPSSDDEDLYQ